MSSMPSVFVHPSQSIQPLHTHIHINICKVYIPTQTPTHIHIPTYHTHPTHESTHTHKRAPTHTLITPQ